MTSLFGFTMRRLSEVHKSSSKNEGYLNTYIYRRISIYLAAIFARLNFTPNYVTYLSLAVSLCACALFLFNSYSLLIVGLLLFHIGKILDCADGQLATLTNQKSEKGAFLDPFFDRIVDIATLLSLSIAHVSIYDTNISLFLMIILLSGWYINSYLNENSNTTNSLDTLRSTTSSLNPTLRKLLKWDGGFSGLIITLAALFMQIPLLIVLYIIITFLPIPINIKTILKEMH